MLAEAVRRQHIPSDQSTIYADGSSMTSKPVAFLLADLGVTKSHSRSYVCPEQPDGASEFRTLKYR